MQNDVSIKAFRIERDFRNYIKLLYFLIYLFHSLFRSVNERGRKKTISTVHQCCHGYGRKRNSQISSVMAPCEKIDLAPLIDTSMKLGGKEFVRSAQKSELEDVFRQNVTVFLPTDASFTEFAENALESVSRLLFAAEKSQTNGK